MRTRNGTCDGCGKRRKLTHPEKKQGLVRAGEEISYYGLCSECFPLIHNQADVVERRKTTRQERPKRRPSIAYPCIGGPLDGQHALTSDFEKPTAEKFRGNSWFREGGMYGHLADEYLEYNSSRSGAKRQGGWPPSMVFLHKTIVPALGVPSER
jgi:hypothetical protein